MVVSHSVHTNLNHVCLRSLSPRYGLGGPGSWPFFPSPSFGLLTFPFILAFTPLPTSTCRFNFPGLILVPSAHTQSGWGWLKKLKSIALTDSEYLMAVMAAFLLSFVAILSRAPLSINAGVLGSSQNCSYIVLALSFRRVLGMPRTDSSSAMSQGYLDFYCMSSAISHLGSGLGP